jgi:hypothetical protein
VAIYNQQSTTQRTAISTQQSTLTTQQSAVQQPESAIDNPSIDGRHSAIGSG